MLSTSVPSFQLTTAGPVTPTEAEILAGVQADMNAAFGGNLNPDLTTPQGQLATSTAAVIGDKNDSLLDLINGVDPAFSTGRMQDAIGRLYFMTRKPAVATSVVLTCIGLAGTPIPVGALARATDGNLYACAGAGTIPVGGSVDLTFQCLTSGPIACPINSVNSIYRTIPGWDSVNNASPGTVGQNVESRAEFEARRQASVSGNARGFNEALRASLLAIDDVLDAYVIDNDTGASATIRGVSLGAGQLYIAVSGGVNAAVAKAIWRKKSPGCPYFSGANTSVSVQDDESGYNAPLPNYTVKFHRPTALPIYVKVRITNSPKVPTDFADQIRAAITAAFNGTDGGARATIGSTVFASRFYAGIASLGTWVNIVDIFIGITGAPTDTSIDVNMDRIPTIDNVNIAVTAI